MTVRIFLGLWAVVLAANAYCADWAMFRGDAQHSGASSEELPSNLELRWSITIPAIEPAWPDQPRMQFDAVYQPIVSGNTLVIASPREDCVRAYNLSDGSELWRFIAGGPFRLPPAAANGKIYAGSDDGYLYAIELSSGKLLWKMKGAPKDRMVLGNERLIDTWPVRGGPVVADGKVYFAAGLFPFMGVFVHCLDAETGAVVWSNSSDGAAYLTQPHGAKSFAGIAPQGSLAIAGDRLLIPNGRAVCASYDRATGKMQYFSFASKFGGHDVVVAGDFFFNGGLVYSVTTGKAAGSALRSPVIAGGFAYGLTEKGLSAQNLGAPAESSFSSVLSKLKAPSAKFKTTATLALDGGNCILVTGQTLYAGAQDKIHAFTLPLSDKQVASRTLPATGNVANLISANGRLIAVTASGQVLCYGSGKAAEGPAPHAQNKGGQPAAVSGDANLIIGDCGIKSGYALLLGADTLPVAHELLAKTDIRIILLEADAAKAESLRRELLRTEIYGTRVAVISGSIAATPLPAYFASLIISTDAAAPDAGPAFWMNAYRVLHPYHGAAYVMSNDTHSGAINALLAKNDNRASVQRVGAFTRLRRSGGVPGGGNWTHEHADAGNTRVSRDQVVKTPLGVLWWGGSSHEGILPRHGHGPQPQVVDGRLIIEGVDLMRALDIYTGRVLWEASLPGVGSYFNNLSHHPGANGTGTNFISTTEGVYVAIGRKCLLLDLDTGATLREFALPADVLPEAVWGYINVSGDYLVAGAGIPRPEKPPEKKPAKDEDEDDDDNTVEDKAAKPVTHPRTVASKLLFVFDRKSGRQLWAAEAKNEFRHNGICAGGGKLFAIDRATPEVAIKMKSPPAGLAEGALLLAFELSTGKPLWRCDDEVFGTWLSYSETHDVLMEAGRRARDTLFDEAKGMRAFKGVDGKVLWQDLKATGPAMIRGATVLKEKTACDLLTGKPLMYNDPITGRAIEWSWMRMYGCNTPAGSEHLLTFRSGAAGFYDLSRNGGTGNFGGFRSSCTHNLVVAGGILCAPDYTRTCVCSYQLQTSVALIPDADVEMWTFVGSTKEIKDPIRRLGLNFGAWGDRVDDEGTQWLEYPSTGGPSPKISIESTPGKLETFCRHAMLITGAKPWVTASGVTGLTALEVPLNDKAMRDYTVRLYFAEVQPLKAGQRVMTVKLQGSPVLEKFDIIAECGGADRSIVKEFRGVRASGKLMLELSPLAGETLLCGLEIIAE